MSYIEYYECPCGNGRIVDDKDETPGFRSHDINIYCDECKQDYKIDLSNGFSNWKVINTKSNEEVKLKKWKWKPCNQHEFVKTSIERYGTNEITFYERCNKCGYEYKI
jgi:hypothetical protein